MSIQTADIKVLMSANAVRKYLGISHRLTKEFLAGVPFVRFGKQPRYDKDDVDRAYVSRKERPS